MIEADLERMQDLDKLQLEIDVEDRQDTLVAIFDTVEMLDKECSPEDMVEALIHIHELTSEFIN